MYCAIIFLIWKIEFFKIERRDKPRVTNVRNIEMLSRSNVMFISLAEKSLKWTHDLSPQNFRKRRHDHQHQVGPKSKNEILNRWKGDASFDWCRAWMNSLFLIIFFAPFSAVQTNETRFLAYFHTNNTNLLLKKSSPLTRLFLTRHFR